MIRYMDIKTNIHMFIKIFQRSHRLFYFLRHLRNTWINVAFLWSMVLWLLVAFDNNYFNFPASSAAGKLGRPRTSEPHDCEFLKFNVMRLLDLSVIAKPPWSHCRLVCIIDIYTITSFLCSRCQTQTRINGKFKIKIGRRWCGSD